ncbi:MAG: helix-turn-helix domain-containing protein, partial [Phycisphaeraceae bacterium]|nr:helix-turn-helix domain-containing protein [Phycisphaeraceae bacterium]
VLSAPRRAALLRLWSGGVPARDLARRFGRSPSAIHRAAHQARAERLLTLDLAPGFEPARDLVLADARLLEPAPVRLALGRPGAATLAEHLRQTTEAGWPDPTVELRRARAYAALKALCREHLAGLDPYAPSATDLDTIETRLLWAARLKAELVRGQQMLVLKTVEARLGRRLETIAGTAARRLVLSAIDAIAESVDRHDPFGAGRLAAPAGIAVNRAMARWEAADGAPVLRSRQAARAEPLVDPAAVELPDWTRTVAPWQAFLEAPEHARRTAHPTDGPLLAARFGFAGERPRTLAELAAEHKVALHVMARRVNSALRRCAAPAQHP